MTSGQPPTRITKNDCPLYNCVYPNRIPNIADEIEQSGRTWKAYMDGTDDRCKHGVEYLRYWVDEKQGKIFCLVEAPDAEAANTVHREAHGLVADHIYPVVEGT